MNVSVGERASVSSRLTAGARWKRSKTTFISEGRDIRSAESPSAHPLARSGKEGPPRLAHSPSHPLDAAFTAAVRSEQARSYAVGSAAASTHHVNEEEEADEYWLSALGDDALEYTRPPCDCAGGDGGDPTAATTRRPKYWNRGE